MLVKVNLTLEVSDEADVFMAKVVKLPPWAIVPNGIIEFDGMGGTTIFDEFRIDPERITWVVSQNAFECFVQWVPGPPKLPLEEVITQLKKRGWEK